MSIASEAAAAAARGGSASGKGNTNLKGPNSRKLPGSLDEESEESGGTPKGKRGKRKVTGPSGVRFPSCLLFIRLFHRFQHCLIDSA